MSRLAPTCFCGWTPDGARSIRSAQSVLKLSRRTVYVIHYSYINIKITYMLRNNFIHSQSEFEDQLHTTLLHTHTHTHTYIHVCVCVCVCVCACARVCQQVNIFHCYFVQINCICWQTSNTFCQPVKYFDPIKVSSSYTNSLACSKVLKYFTADLLLFDYRYTRHMKIFFTNF